MSMGLGWWFATAAFFFGLGYIVGDRILWIKRIYELA